MGGIEVGEIEVGRTEVGIDVGMDVVGCGSGVPPGVALGGTLVGHGTWSPFLSRQTVGAGVGAGGVGQGTTVTQMAHRASFTSIS